LHPAHPGSRGWAVILAVPGHRGRTARPQRFSGPTVLPTAARKREKKPFFQQKKLASPGQRRHNRGPFGSPRPCRRIPAILCPSCSNSLHPLVDPRWPAAEPFFTGCRDAGRRFSHRGRRVAGLARALNQTVGHANDAVPSRKACGRSAVVRSPVRSTKEP